MRPSIAISGSLACALLGVADLTVLNEHLVPTLIASRSEALKLSPLSHVATAPPGPVSPAVGVSPALGSLRAETSAAPAERPPSPTPTPTPTDLTVPQELTLTIEFETGASVITPAGRADLERFVSRLGAREGLRLAIDGHADRRGPPELNRTLSLARATAVREELERLGVERRWIDVQAHGASLPKVEGTSDDALARNRRVELHARGGR